ncbi:MAG: DUF1559 domain-containing protein [Gemmatales bacterium]|nr:DUF1559 domain-containing protein [Gemmatales bacterium]
MALLLPAIQRVREASNRMRCGNNLSQIAMAFHNLHNDYNIFPTSGTRNLTVTIINGQPAGPPFQDWSWAYQILPYLELSSLHSSVQPGWQAHTNNTVTTTPVAVYFCPSRRRPGVRTDGRAGIDYLANAGIPGAVSWPNGAVYNSPPYGDWTASGMVIRAGTGLTNRSVSLDGGVPDGTSNTLLLGDKAFQISQVNRTPGYDNESYCFGWDWDNMGTPWFQPSQDSNNAVQTYWDNVFAAIQFGSMHPGSFNAVMADRSLKRIRYSVQLAVFRMACLRDDGQAFSLQNLE